MNQNEIKILKQQNILGKDFVVYGDVLEPLFLAKDVAEMIDYDISNVSKMVKNVDDDEKIIARTNNTSAIFLTEDGLYEVLMQSRKPVAKAFKKEVKSILKQLRRTGAVITESATDESIDYQTKYGKYRIRKTFNESTNLRATYEEFAVLSKIERESKRIDNKDRIKSCKIIINVLEEKIANEVLTLRASELIAIQELISDIQSDIIKLSNKLNGGQKSAMTKRINQLESENEELKSQFLDVDWKKINNHGFTENCKLEYDPNLKRMVRTRAFRSWLNNFDYSDFRDLNCDISKPMTIYLHFGKLEKFDTSNLEKSVIDLIADRYDFDDNLIINKVTTSETVNSYQEGFILFDLVNIDNE